MLSAVVLQTLASLELPDFVTASKISAREEFDRARKQCAEYNMNYERYQGVSTHTVKAGHDTFQWPEVICQNGIILYQGLFGWGARNFVAGQRYLSSTCFNMWFLSGAGRAITVGPMHECPIRSEHNSREHLLPASETSSDLQLCHRSTQVAAQHQLYAR